MAFCNLKHSIMNNTIIISEVQKTNRGMLKKNVDNKCTMPLLQFSYQKMRSRREHVWEKTLGTAEHSAFMQPSVQSWAFMQWPL